MTAARAKARNPEALASDGNVELLAALADLILETVHGDPNWDEFRQGNTRGPSFRR
jgi:toxin YhaV